MRMEQAHRTGQSCGSCGRALAPDEPVWVVPLRAGYDPRTRSPMRWKAPICGGCAGPRAHDRLRFRHPEPCDGCGRDVTSPHERRHRRWVVCSQRCAWTARNRLRAEAAAAARAKRCAVCGREFEAGRRDALTCSPACRQKAYRRRQAGLGSCERPSST